MSPVSRRGFSLLELMIVVAVVGILVALALPSYNDQIQRTRRSDGRNKLLEVSLAQQRFYTNCNRYAAVLGGQQADCSGLGMDLPLASEHGHYQIELLPQAGNWVLRAVPQGVQAQDVRCATLLLSSTGAKTATGIEPESCW